MNEPTLSAYIQCHANKAALYHALLSFRRAYPSEPITLVSDCGEDFAKFATRFNLCYYRSEKNCDPRTNMGKEGVQEYLKRIYEHCLAVRSDYVVILEEDVTTLRRVRRFPDTDCGGPRLNSFADPLNRYLQSLNKTTQDYGYAMCGGSIFNRQIYIECFEKANLDLNLLETLDQAAVQFSDVALTLIFLINGFTYSVWDEVSETKHPIEDLRIFRDAAFDHADKTWYGVAFDDTLLDLLPSSSSS